MEKIKRNPKEKESLAILERNDLSSITQAALWADDTAKCSLKCASTEVVSKTRSTCVAECWRLERGRWGWGHAHVPLGFQNGENFLRGITIFSVGEDCLRSLSQLGNLSPYQLDGSVGLRLIPRWEPIRVYKLPGTH